MGWFFIRYFLLSLEFVQISRPEDWERTPDPKKYFVQFFGTEEM